MGRLTDMLPEIEAQIRQQAIWETLGCARLGCHVETYHSIADVGLWVRHNDERKFFEDMVGMSEVPIFRDGRINTRPVTHIRRDVSEWIVGIHGTAEARQVAERQAVAEASGWQAHAEMVSLI